jgi:hypothetical protein
VPLAAEGEFALSRAQLEMGLDKWFSARLDRITTPGGDHDLLAWLADLAGQQGDAGALARYAPAAAEAAARVGHRPYGAMAARALGVEARLAGRWDEAEAQLSTALEAFEALGTRWQAGRTRFELGVLAEARGQPGAARAQYAAALADFEALGAGPMVGRTKGVLSRLP